MTSAPNVKKLAIKGASWVTITYFAQQFIRLVGNVLLSRLLVPELFGLMSLANRLRLGIQLFSDLGTTQSVVQSAKGDEPVFVQTAWTVEALRGLVVFLITLIIAFPVAMLYDERRMLLVLPAVGMNAVFIGFQSTKIVTFKRHLQHRQLSILALWGQGGSIICMVIWAYFDPTVRALALGGMITPFIAMIYTYVVFQAPPPKFVLDRESLKEIVSFGRWIMLSSIMMFLAENSDQFILPKLASLSVLGVYSVAWNLAGTPRTLIKRLSTTIIFPAISLKNELPRAELKQKIAKQRRLLLIGGAAMLAILVCTGDLVVGALYDKRYIDATWMMPILCAGIWFVILFYTLSPALLAVGQPKFVAFSNFTSFIVIALGMPIGFHYFDTPGAITVISFSDFFPYFILLIGLFKEKLLFLWQDFLSTLLFVGLVTLLIFIRYQLGFGLPLDNLFA